VLPLWWDAQEKDPGGGDVRNTRRRSTTGVRAEDFGLDRDTIHRWRKKLSAPGKFDAELEKTRARCLKICEAHRGHSDLARMSSSGENE
jgi:hypothetical protein